MNDHSHTVRMVQRLAIGAITIALTVPIAVFAGSITYSTPGTYTFTIPWYATIDAYTYGAGGGGGGGAWSENACTGYTSAENGNGCLNPHDEAGNGGLGGNGSASYFRTLTTDSSFDIIGYGGSGGGGGGYNSAFAGDYYIDASGDAHQIYQYSPYNGAGGSAGSWTGYGASGSAGGGTAGGTGGESYDRYVDSGYHGGTGGSGGLAYRSWNKGDPYGPVYNSTITVIVGSAGSGGAGGGGYATAGGSGSNGAVSIYWTDGPAPTCAVTVDANPINSGGSTTLRWSSTDITGGWFYITNVGYVSGSGSATIAPSSSTTYSGTVSGPGGTGNCGVTLTVNPPASADVSANPTSIAYNTASTISWTGSNVNNCTLAGGTWGSGTSVAASGSGSSGSLTTSTTYTFSCKYIYNQSQTVTDTQQVTVAAAPAPSCGAFSANPTSISQGNSATITWSCSNATSCTGTGFSTGGATSGSTSVSPTQTTSYSLSCTGAGGTTNYANGTTVSVSCAPIYSCSGQTIQYTNSSCETSNVTTCVSPSYCSAGSSSCVYTPPSGGLGGNTAIRITPRLVRSGGTATVTWDVQNVVACTVSGNGNTWTGTSGSQVSSPIVQQVTYTVVCDDFDGDSLKDDFSESATVYLIPTWFEF